MTGQLLVPKYWLLIVVVRENLQNDNIIREEQDNTGNKAQVT
jgi:hypothetical protein